MKCDQNAIFGQLHISFKVPITKFYGMTKCRNRVFRKIFGAATMGEGNELAIVMRG
jgi:hypothetical protein